MIKTVLEKREDLEQFLNEQIVGPGAFNKRLMFTSDWDNCDFKGMDLTQGRGLDNMREVIAELPAYQYSSAILFPISISSEEAALSVRALGLVDSGDEMTDLAPGAADDEEFMNDREDSVSSKNQNYPNTCGFSFAVSAHKGLNFDFELRVKFRKYQSVVQQDSRVRKLGVWVERYSNQTVSIIKDYFVDIFETIQLDGNVFVYLSPLVDINQFLYSLDYINLDRLLKGTVLPLIESLLPGKKLFREITKSYNGVSYNSTMLYEDTLNDEIQGILLSGKDNFVFLKPLIESFEIYQQTKYLVNELKAIHRSSSRRNFATPIWESRSFDFPVQLPAFTETVIQRDEISVGPLFPDLFISYQYLKEGSSIYVKLILVNKATITLRPGEPEQLNKKNTANELSYFGVEMIVCEKTPNSFVAYNPPNLLIIDEEDNLNKLLYRNFKDFSEGYNTSVSWGNLGSSNLRFVRTDFLPQQDTPSIDFKPSKVEGNRIIELVEEDLLSIRGLATINSRSDTDILDSLSEMVYAYGKWIDSKSIELQSENLVEGKRLLEKQINACRLDHHRLVRNVELLRNSPPGMAAFRTMNTAMFMQLHHGTVIKAPKKTEWQPFVPTDSNDKFYCNVLLEKEYRWRSFQLAFVLLNVDAFIRPGKDDPTVADVFGTGWPERNDLADLVWFPTGGGKTEAYLGIIAFAIAYRRFTNNSAMSKGTTVLMRYTLRLLTLQQFQRATLLICALEVIRKDGFPLPKGFSLGTERITIGLFVGGGSLPNKWDEMRKELIKVSEHISKNQPVITKMPHTECPWCGGSLFIDSRLPNIEPGINDRYGKNGRLTIMCNTLGCTFHSKRPNDGKSLPLRLFDEDIYKYPPTLLFGTVDKFATLANKVSSESSSTNLDSRRLLGNGYDYKCLPPELIIQDELHLLLGPLGSAVGLFEKSIDELCSYHADGIRVRPKVITSTATTRNTDKQIFAIFDRRCEIFPKQGITCDDAFFSFYKRESEDTNVYASNRRYVGILPVGKTQVWMQLRIASICLVHRLKFLREKFTYDQIFTGSYEYERFRKTLDYYHTVLSYFNSLKEVGKTQSQLTHYLPGDLSLIERNVMSPSILSRMIKPSSEIYASELTGRLSGEEVKSNLSKIESSWEFAKLPVPPELVIATNMISVGIDVSRFNIMIINSMPRNIAEYIQASSRVARESEGIVFTVHHPFRSRDISHYQRFIEFHEKFYSYVEPISVTPFANKALDRYFAMFLAVVIRHSDTLGLSNNGDAIAIDTKKIGLIQDLVKRKIREIHRRSVELNHYLKNRMTGVKSNVDGIIGDEEILDVEIQLNDLLIDRWLDRVKKNPSLDLVYRKDNSSAESLFSPRNTESLDQNWNVKESLREIAPSAVIKTIQQ